MSDIKQPYYIFKICILGQAAVGKTCIAKRLCFNTFTAHTKLTIGIEFYTFDLPIIIKNGEKTYVRLSIWDFGGQEQFKKLFRYYINGVNGIFMVFDLTDLQTLINLDFWYKQLNERNIFDSPKIVLGTKYDLIDKEHKKNKVDNLIIEQFITKHEEKYFYKTSSKDNYNILLVFKELTEQILNKSQLDYEQLI